MHRIQLRIVKQIYEIVLWNPRGWQIPLGMGDLWLDGLFSISLNWTL